MVPTECHSIGARSPKDSLRLLSSSSAPSRVSGFVSCSTSWYFSCSPGRTGQTAVSPRAGKGGGGEARERAGAQARAGIPMRVPLPDTTLPCARPPPPPPPPHPHPPEADGRTNKVLDARWAGSHAPCPPRRP